MIKDDKRFLRTRQAISDAMWQLMQEKDFNLISIGEIAERANINRVTFYRHYVDKYDWLDKCIMEMLEELIPISEIVHTSRDPKQLIKAFRKTFCHFDKNFHLYSILMDNKGTAFFQERFKKIQLELLTKSANPKHAYKPEFDFEIHFVASAVAGSVEWWIKNDRPLSIEQMAQKMLDIHQKLPWYNNQ